MSQTLEGTAPAIGIGTAYWAPILESEKTVDEIVNLLRKYKVTILDTARVYGGGGSETVIGKKGLSKEFTIITKPSVMPGTGSQILEMAKASFEALQTDSVHTYIFHGPDEVTPCEVQVEAIQKLYEEGRFKRFGFANFTKEQVLEYWNIAKAKGYFLPSVYQGSYSPAVRRNETLLFPTLRELGFSIQAYSPMAGGFLAKTPEYIQQGKGLWDPDTPFGKMLRYMYDKPSYLKMLEEFGKLSEDSGVSRMGLAYRWVRFHSILRGDLGDEILISGNTTAQVEEALIELEKGPLEAWVADKIDDLWELVKDDAPVDNLQAVRKAFGPPWDLA